MKRVLGSLGLAFALAACGSTAQQGGATHDQLLGPGSANGDGLSAPVGTTPGEGPASGVAGPPGTTPAAGSPGPGGRAGRTVGAAGSGSVLGRQRATAARAPSAGLSGAGFTATEIKVGVSISSSANAAFGAYGASGLSFPDGKALTNAYVSYLNRTGGIAGRNVVPVFYDYNATGNIETSDAAACAAWTQDRRVAAALGVRAGASGSGDALTPCLSKAGVPWMSGAGDAAKFARYSKTLYAPSLINSTRLAKSVVDALYGNGFFTSGARIGVVYRDDAEMARAVNDGIIPALAAHGLSLSKQAAESNAFTESANIELQFATAHITHVLFVAPGGAAPWQFMQSAEQNRHHYRYGISSDDQPSIVLQQFAPQGQLATTSGFGYAPAQDVSPSQQPKPTPALAACLKVFHDAGFDTSSSTSQYAMSFVCDPFQLLRAGWTGQTALSTTSLADGIDALGTSFGIAGSFAARFGNGRHDGADAYRLLRYDGACSCFEYTGPVRRTG